MNTPPQEAVMNTEEQDMQVTQPLPQGEFGDAWDDLDGKPKPKERVEAAPAEEVVDTAEETKPEAAQEPQDTPEVLKARLAAAEERTRMFEHQARSEAGRQAALQRRLQELEQRVAQPTPTPAKAEEARVAAEDLEKLKSEFPDIAGPVESAINRTRAELKAELDRQLSEKNKELEEIKAQVQPVIVAQREMAKRAEMERLDAEIPDWRQVVRTPEFGSWLTKQHPAIQTLAGSERAEDAITALRMYQSVTVKPQATDTTPQRVSAARQAAVLPATSRAAPSRQQVPNDFSAAWDAYDTR